MTWTIVQGDTSPLLIATLSDESGAVGLSGASVEITATIGSTTVTKTGTVLDASAGRVSFDFAGELPVGIGSARIKVTFANGKIRKFPSEAAIQLRVLAA